MNIAEYKNEIVKLEAEHAEVMKRAQPIFEKIQNLKQKIRDNCSHHEDLISVQTDTPEDEYGKILYNSTTYKIKCTICEKTVLVYKSKVSGITFQKLLSMSPEDLAEYL